jgi:hypothetical protein
MTFLHASLLLGAIAATIPIVLHMLGRRQPKPIVFPALRFVRQTAINAQRGWSIKRWLLLVLRVLLLAVLAFGFASPRVQSNVFGTYLLIGLIGILALLATATALTSFGSRRSWLTTTITSLIAVFLWIVGGAWFSYTAMSGHSVPMPTASGPICAAVVLDTSPSMGYRYHNVTRLDAAKEMATWLMDRLPAGSQIAIVNNDAVVRLNQDRISANRQLDRTIVEGRATNLVQRISSSIDALRKSELERREIYVLSDLSEPSWRDSESSDIPAKLARNEEGKGIQGENVLLQIIDVSVPLGEISNWSLHNFKLSQQTVTPGSPVTISAELQSSKGSGTQQMNVELHAESIERTLQNNDGKVVLPSTHVVDRQWLEVTDGGAVPFRLTLKDLVEGTNHAELRISRPDPLDVDNVVYLSIEARTQSQTLVISDDAIDGPLACFAIDPDYAATAVVPKDKSDTDKKKPDAAPKPSPREPLYKLESSNQLGILDLARYSSIVLYNPKNITADSADRLGRWVEQGGGLMIVLGPGFETPESIMNSPLASLLPGSVKRMSRRALTDRSISLAPSAKNHPIWTIFERPVEEIPWIKYAVFRHWDIEELGADASVLMRFTSSEQPALIEQFRKQGRILTFALPYPEPSEHRNLPDKIWSELYQDWVGFALFQGSVRYLAAWDKQQLNYFVEEPAVLDNNSSQFPSVYTLYNPQGEETRVESSQDSFVYTFTRYPGQYRMRGLRPQGPVVRGFSINVNRQEISLERVSPATLEKALGKDQYRVAKEREDVQSSLGEGRYGRDLAPFLLMVFVMMVMAEQTMASRFYALSKRAGS